MWLAGVLWFAVMPAFTMLALRFAFAGSVDEVGGGCALIVLVLCARTAELGVRAVLGGPDGP